jgi:hypothetical protein
MCRLGFHCSMRGGYLDRVHGITWRMYADRLTPQQIATLERWDSHPNHPRGPDGHRQGMCALACWYSVAGRGGLN